MCLRETPFLKEIDFLPVMKSEGFVIDGGVSWSSCYDEEQIDMEFRRPREHDCRR
jgi:hypothetical protein